MYNVFKITKVSDTMKDMGYSNFETLVGEFTHPIDAKYFTITEGFQFKSPTYEFEIRKVA
tara:strand:- start:390 stop:569 length:180 start_codon:yes stop_codon:yes gene_type:complete